MSEVFKYNTEEVVKQQSVPQQQAPTLRLVSETDPILRQVLTDFDFKNPPVNAIELASALVETCKQNRGIGLSANQCGYPFRVFVMGANDDYVAFFNPRITWKSEEDVHMVEGCLSFPFLGLMITRPKEIEVEYQSYTGDVKQTKFTGVSARCFQHELDHMNGIVYTDRVKPLALQQGMKKRNKIMKKIGLK
jgi:peptide deformylase